MMGLFDLPLELLSETSKQYVKSVGVCKGIRLRLACSEGTWHLVAEYDANIRYSYSTAKSPTLSLRQNHSNCIRGILN